MEKELGILKSIMFAAFDVARVGIEDKARLECVRDFIGDFFRLEMQNLSTTSDTWWRSLGRKRLTALKIVPTPEWIEFCALYEFLFTVTDDSDAYFYNRLQKMARYVFDDKFKRDYFVSKVLEKARSIVKEHRPNDM